MRKVEARITIDGKGGEVREAAILAARLAFASVVDDLLKDRGWTRTELANRLKVNRSRVTRMLSEKSDIQLSSVVGIFHELDVDFATELRELRAREYARQLEEDGGWASPDE